MAHSVSKLFSWPLAHTMPWSSPLTPPPKTHRIWATPTSGLGRGSGVWTPAPPPSAAPVQQAWSRLWKEMVLLLSVLWSGFQQQYWEERWITEMCHCCRNCTRCVSWLGQFCRQSVRQTRHLHTTTITMLLCPRNCSSVQSRSVAVSMLLCLWVVCIADDWTYSHNNIYGETVQRTQSICEHVTGDKKWMALWMWRSGMIGDGCEHLSTAWPCMVSVTH